MMDVMGVPQILPQLFPQLVSSNATCTATWCITPSFCLTEPTLVPTCFLALAIGIFFFKRFKAINEAVGGTSLYAISFLAYGIMMTTAMFVHCIVTDTSNFPKWLITALAIMDVGLTSCIAVSFFFDGLADLGILNPSSLFATILMITAYAGIFIAWTLSILGNSQYGFLILYMGLISIACFLYLIMELTYMKRNDRQSAFKYLAMGGACGALGMAAIVFSEQICTLLGPYFSSDFLWFLLSDLAMIFIGKYVIESRAIRSNFIQGTLYFAPQDLKNSGVSSASQQRRSRFGSSYNYQ